MRGKGDICIAADTGIGITPAYAGKSRPLQTAKKGYWDHPRLCGEKDIVHAVSKCNVGSPPPMRGKD